MQMQLTPRQRDILGKLVEEYVATGQPGGSQHRVERSQLPVASSTVRHVQVLLLQPNVVVVVVITSTGDVSKRVVTFDRPVDPGLVNWAGEYLNERVAGLGLGTHLLRRRFEDPSLSAGELEFLGLLQPAFTELLRAEQRLYVGGAASLLEDVRAEELGVYRRLLEALEKRAALLELVDEALDA